MDDLELPPDRATLFDSIDADGSGTLQLGELVQGLLKIRGELNKSDTVAALLATKALQNVVVEMLSNLVCSKIQGVWIFAIWTVDVCLPDVFPFSFHVFPYEWIDIHHPSKFVILYFNFNKNSPDKAKSMSYPKVCRA